MRKLSVVLIFLVICLAPRVGRSQFGNASRLQGRNICSDAPTNGQSLTWVAASNCWKPATGSGSGIVSMTTGTVDPTQGAGCSAPTSSSLTFYMNTTAQALWMSTAASGNCWQKVLSTTGLGPFSISGTTGALATGTAASRGACSAAGYYLATDTHALTSCDGTAWSATLNPSGSQACIMNSTAGAFQCYDSGGNVVNGGGGGSVFTGSTAPETITYSATPSAISLADVSVKSPIVIQFGTLTGSVTFPSPSFTSKTAGAKFSVLFAQNGTGGYAVTWGTDVLAGSTCTIDPTLSQSTQQDFEILNDGTTVKGTGCSGSNPNVTFLGTVSIPNTLLPGKITGNTWYFMPGFNGAACDGTTDDTTALNALLSAVFSANGGVIWVNGHCVISSGSLLIPTASSGGAFPYSVTIRITGAGDGEVSSAGALGVSASILDLRYNASVAKIDARGSGVLEIDHIQLIDGGTDCAPFIQTTNTVLRIHNTTFTGYQSYANACNDAIILGGTTTSQDGSATAAFQGYGTVIESNAFYKIRRAVWLRVYANAVDIIANDVSFNSGSSLTNGAAIDLDPSPAGANGNYIAGNLIEVNAYPYAFACRSIGCIGNTFIGNSTWDPISGGAALGAYLIEGKNNQIIVSHDDVPSPLGSWTEFGTYDASNIIITSNGGVSSYARWPTTPGIPYCTGTPCTAWGGTSLTTTSGLQGITFTASVPILTALGTSATVNTGTSGATIPLLNGTNTFSGITTHTAAVIIAKAPASANCTGSALANCGTFSVGGGPFDGSTTGKFVGSTGGTSIAVNEATGYTGDLMNLQIAGNLHFLVTAGYAMQIGGMQISSNSINAGSNAFGNGNSSALNATSDGVWNMTNHTATTFTRLAIGPDTSGFPGLCPTGSGGALRIMEAGGCTTDAPISASVATLSAVAATVGAGRVSFGATTAVVSNCGSLATACLVINVAGTTRYIPYF